FFEASDGSLEHPEIRQHVFELDFEVDALRGAISKSSSGGSKKPLGEVIFQQFRLAFSGLLKMATSGILALTVNRLGASLIRTDAGAHAVRFLDDVDLTFSMGSRSSTQEQMTSTELAPNLLYFEPHAEITAITTKAVDLDGKYQNNFSVTSTASTKSAQPYEGPSQAPRSNTMRSHRHATGEARVLLRATATLATQISYGTCQIYIGNLCLSALSKTWNNRPMHLHSFSWPRSMFELADGSSGASDIFYAPYNGVVTHGNKELGFGIAKNESAVQSPAPCYVRINLSTPLSQGQFQSGLGHADKAYDQSFRTFFNPSTFNNQLPQLDMIPTFSAFGTGLGTRCTLFLVTALLSTALLSTAFFFASTSIHTTAALVVDSGVSARN
ncbi:hypothetical protein BDR04DRAFT_1214101, partial [Suillus decipiens]